MRLRSLAPVIAVLALAVAGACAHPQPPAVTIDPSIARLAEADTLFRAGCYDCLLGAYREYDTLRLTPSAAAAATVGVFRTALLIDIRERELGLPAGDYLQKARSLAAASPELSAGQTPLLDIISALRIGPGGARAPVTDAQVATLFQLTRNRAQWTAALKDVAANDELTGYVWVVMACDSLAALSMNVDDVLNATGALRDLPVIAFAYSTACVRGNADRLRILLDRDSRFGEINYLLGLAALGRRPYPDVDGADDDFRGAFEWRAAWPALTLSTGNLALVTEDFPRAFDFFDRTLALVPGEPDAIMGKIRALTYLGRYQEALAATESLLADGRTVGEARYWRAFNDNQLERYDEAWMEIELAQMVFVNANVYKLAGLIAFRRREIDVAMTRLTQGISLNPSDCETKHYLQTALADQGKWAETAAAASAAAACFDEAEVAIRLDINSLKASNAAPERMARMVATRERELRSNDRMRAAAWFNAAVSTFNLGRRSEAREFASKIAGDDQFGERVRALLLRLQ